MSFRKLTPLASDTIEEVKSIIRYSAPWRVYLWSILQSFYTRHIMARDWQRKIKTDGIPMNLMPGLYNEIYFRCTYETSHFI